jgi:hypothetical protein
VFNDSGQFLPSQRRISQWGTTWGQFLDHDFALRIDGQGTPMPWDASDPLEEFTNNIGIIPFRSTAVAPGSGVTTPREQQNRMNSYLDAEAVYGATPQRLEWLREGPVDGDLGNNGAKLLLPDAHLPQRDARGDATKAPEVDDPTGLAERARVAGDIRANENAALTAVQTLFAREHNRIVGLLPRRLGEEEKFQIARRVVIAEQQHITYTEFLPTLGVRLSPYRGYRPDVNATVGNEFATIGYRAHSMIRGDLKLKTRTGRYTREQLDALRAKGAQVTENGAQVEITTPSSLISFNPDLVQELQLGPLLQGIGLQDEARNDEQIDNVLRSLPLKPRGCPTCDSVVFDVASIDVERSRDHGMPSYNDLRRAYGLAPKASFRAVTGESTESFPVDPELTPGDEINDPDSLDFVHPGVRRTSVAARLKATYGDLGTLDAFVGMMAEPHLAGSEFGELQHAIWRKQFEAMRDGDRFYTQNDPVLTAIRLRYGIDYRRDLGDVIASNTDIPRCDLNRNVFRTA